LRCGKICRQLERVKGIVETVDKIIPCSYQDTGPDFLVIHLIVWPNEPKYRRMCKTLILGRTGCDVMN
jgi:hypothetical protein